MNIENAITIDTKNPINSHLIWTKDGDFGWSGLKVTPVNDTFDPSIDSGITANGFAGDRGVTWPSPKLFDISESAGGSERPDTPISAAFPTRDDVRKAWADWIGENNRSHQDARLPFLRDVVLPRYGAKSIERLPDDRLADALVCLDVIKRNKPIYIAEAKALLDEHVPVTDVTIGEGPWTKGGSGGGGIKSSGIKSSGSIYANSANVVIDQPVDHDMTPDRLITLNIRTQEFHHILAGLMNLMKIPLNGTGFVATDHGHSPSMTHAEIDALHDDLIIQADMKPQGRRVRNRGEMYLIEEIEHAGGTIRHDGTVEWPVVKHHLAGGKRF